LDAREASCRELVTVFLDRIDAVDGDLHCFLRTRREAALAEADRFDREGRRGLEGVPIALKDILCTKGEETTAGSNILVGLELIVGQDPCDATSVELEEPIAVPDRLDMAGVRVGIPSDLLAQGIEPGVRAAFDATLRTAEGLGAQLVEVALPHAGYALPAYY